MKEEYNYTHLTENELKILEEIILEGIKFQNWFSIAVVDVIKEEVILFTQ